MQLTSGFAVPRCREISDFSVLLKATEGFSRPVRWGVKNSFFTKRILLFINNLQIFGKKVFSFQFLLLKKQIEIRFLPTVEMTAMLVRD